MVNGGNEEWREFRSSRWAAVVFLGKLFAKVERVVPSLSEKQNDFAFSSERFNYPFVQVSTKIKAFQSRRLIRAALV